MRAAALSQSDVNEIIMNAVATANMTRAVIRLPPGSRAKMTIAVSDLDGTLLGLYRMPDGTVFSADVACLQGPQRDLVQYHRREGFARRARGNRSNESYHQLRRAAAVSARNRRIGRWPIFPVISLRHCEPLHSGVGTEVHLTPAT